MFERWKEHETRMANRPGQAPIGEPCWIVINFSRHKEQPEERRIALFFRHPSEESAITEAKRLADKHRGKRFGVFASGPSFKVELPTLSDLPAQAEPNDPT